MDLIINILTQFRELLVITPTTAVKECVTDRKRKCFPLVILQLFSKNARPYSGLRVKVEINYKINILQLAPMLVVIPNVIKAPSNLVNAAKPKFKEGILIKVGQFVNLPNRRPYR